MVRKLCLVSVLALAWVAPVTARAQDASVAGSTAVADARARYDASETAYAQASGASGSGGFVGQLQQLASAGNGAQANQLVQARADARSGLESAVATYLGALKGQLDAARSAGQDQAPPAIVALIQTLRSRLQALATDAVNDKLAAMGLGGRASQGQTGAQASSTTGLGGYGQDSPPSATSAATPLAAPVLAAPAPAPLDPGPVTANGAAARTQEKPTVKPRKATGRLVVVAGGTPEATLERLEKALALLRAGKPLEETREGEVYLVERWRERTPSWVRLSSGETRDAELRKLKLHPGATCSVSGAVEGSPARGEVVVLRDWKLLALSAGDRLGQVAPRAAAAPAPAPEKPIGPGPLGAEEENFND